MLGDKPWALMAYGAIGAGLALGVPRWLARRTGAAMAGAAAAPAPARPASESPLWGWAMALVCAVLVVRHGDLLPWRHLAYGALLALGLALAQPRAKLRHAAAAGLGLWVASTLPWWLHTPDHRLQLGSTLSVVFLLLTAAAFVLHEGRLPRRLQPTPRARSLLLGMLVLALGSVTLLWCFSTGMVLLAPNLWAWHHWGAYVGPAQLVQQGAVPLHDIPVQYGLGVTTLLAAASAGPADMWPVMHGISAAAAWLLVCVVGGIALALTRGQPFSAVAAALVSVVVACLVWPANPEWLLSPTTTPSTSGLRFLPGALMLAWAVHHARSARPGQPAGGRAPIFGHALLVLCALWSPEAGVHAAAVWGPYVVWLRRSVTKGAAEVAAAAVIGLGGAVAAYRAAFGVWPGAQEYLLYLLYPPGPLPINPYGTVWFALACFGCCAWALAWARRHASLADEPKLVTAWLVLLWSLATFSYYLGRSHDANVLNLMPGLVLTLLAARSLAPSGSVRTLATVLLSSTLGWLAVVNTQPWRAVIDQGRLLEVAPQELARRFDRSSPAHLYYVEPVLADQQRRQQPRFVPDDAIRAVAHIRQQYAEPATVFDELLLLDLAEPSPPWGAIHGPANYLFVPPAIRERHVVRVAHRLRRPGWWVYQKAYEPALNASFLANLDAAYRRTGSLDFGSYAAIRFEPR